MRLKDMLHTSDMQFAFKVVHTLVVKEVVCYYVNNNSDVYSCYVDAAKAFEIVRHDKLFDVLKDKKIPALFLLLYCILLANT